MSCTGFMPHPQLLASPEEDEVSLVVEGDDPPAPELRVLVEQAAQHAPHTPTQPRVEVVQQQLWTMAADTTVALIMNDQGISTALTETHHKRSLDDKHQFGEHCISSLQHVSCYEVVTATA